MRGETRHLRLAGFDVYLSSRMDRTKTLIYGGATLCVAFSALYYFNTKHKSVVPPKDLNQEIKELQDHARAVARQFPGAVSYEFKFGVYNVEIEHILAQKKREMLE